MTNQQMSQYGDATTREFWAGAERRELMLQYCADSNRYQFYPRPFDIETGSDNVEWVKAKGTGTVYSLATVHVAVSELLEPPYLIAVVELDEGVRVTTNIVNGTCHIGDRVEVTWHEREGMPPLPMFQPLNTGN